MVQAKSLFRLGIVTFIMVVLVAILLVWKSGIFLRAAGYEVIGEFGDVNGLLIGGQVRYRGYEVGRVTAIDPNPRNIIVHFWVNRGVDIPTGSYLRVVFDGLIGEKFINIHPNTASSIPIAPGSSLPGYSTAGLADFVDVGTRNLEQLKAMLTALRGVLTQKEVLSAIRATILNTSDSTASLSQLLQQMNEMVKSGDIQSMFRNFNDVSMMVKNTTNQLLVKDKFGENLAEISRNFSDLSKNLKEISAQVAALTGDKEVMISLANTVKNLDGITTQVNDILQEPSLKPEIVGAVKEGRKTLKASSDILQAIASMNVTSQAGLIYQFQSKRLTYAADTDIWFQNSGLRFGISDRQGETRLVHLQYGYRFAPQSAFRVGFFYSYPGLGIEYRLTPTFSAISELYNLNAPSFNLWGRYRLTNQISFSVGGSDLFRPASQLEAGMNYSFLP